MDPTNRALLMSVGAELAEISDYPDPYARAIRGAELIATAQGQLMAALVDLRCTAVAELVATSSVAEVAERLGISRARVYALVDGRGAVGTTRPRRASEPE